MENPLRKLPTEALQNVRDYASDRVQPHPTAALIKELTFDRDEPGERGPFNDGYPSLFVRGDMIKRMRKCSNRLCVICTIPGHSCRLAKLVTRPVDHRRYILSDFNEPDRYMEDNRPPTYVDCDGDVRWLRPETDCLNMSSHINREGSMLVAAVFRQMGGVVT